MSAMDLLERYLQAIGQYLPEESRVETLRELRANLLDQMDARAESQGRTLEEGDVAAVLREHGKPEVVALRYLPQRSLIGPAVFPFYVFTLQRATPIWLLVYSVAKVVDVANSGVSFSRGLAEYGSDLIPAGLAFLAVVTLVFAVIDWAREQGKLGKKFYEWDPMKLQPVKPQGEQNSLRSLWKGVIDLAFHSLWLAYLLWVPWHPFWLFGPGFFFLQAMNVAWAPVWTLFYQLLVLGTGIKLVAKLLAFAPRSKHAARTMRVLGDGLGFVGVAWLAWHSVFFVGVQAGANPELIAQVNHAMALAFRVATVVALFGFVRERMKDRQSGPVGAYMAL